MAKPVQESLSLLTKTQQDINSLLKGVDMGANLLSINAKFSEIKARLEFMGAVAEPESVKQNTDEMFPPITNFMGEKILLTKTSSADLNPGKNEKDVFLKKVEKLYDTLPAYSSEQLLKSYVTASDLLILRGVAKKAGVPDYKESPLTIQFIEKIKAAVAEQKGEQQLQQQVDENSKSEQQRHKEAEIEKVKAELRAEQLKSEELGKQYHSLKEQRGKTKPNQQHEIDKQLAELEKKMNESDEIQLKLEEILEANVIIS